MAELQGQWPWLPWEKRQWHTGEYPVKEVPAVALADMSLLCATKSLLVPAYILSLTLQALSHLFMK